jgi:hypothetical protein
VPHIRVQCGARGVESERTRNATASRERNGKGVDIGEVHASPEVATRLEVRALEQLMLPFGEIGILERRRVRRRGRRATAVDHVLDDPLERNGVAAERRECDEQHANVRRELRLDDIEDRPGFERTGFVAHAADPPHERAPAGVLRGGPQRLMPPCERRGVLDELHWQRHASHGSKVRAQTLMDACNVLERGRRNPGVARAQPQRSLGPRDTGRSKCLPEPRLLR